MQCNKSNYTLSVKTNSQTRARNYLTNNVRQRIKRKLYFNIILYYILILFYLLI